MADSRSSDEVLRVTIQRIARRIRRNRDRDLAESQLAVLFLLEHEDRSPGQLAELELITAPSMNRTLNSLQDAGLVERRRSSDDARMVLVTLTAAGHKTVADTRARRTEWFAMQMARLSDEERSILEKAIPVLRRITE